MIWGWVVPSQGEYLWEKQEGGEFRKRWVYWLVEKVSKASGEINLPDNDKAWH